MKNTEIVNIENKGQRQPASGLSISVVIPTWNGIGHLQENLPSVIVAANIYQGKTGEPVEILVVDDGSQDQTSSIIPEEFPNVKLIERRQNGGFAAACNTGFQNACNQLVALLNNDVRLDPEYLVHQAKHFSAGDVFAVTAKVYDWEGTHFTTGGRIGRFRRGFWSVYFNYDVSSDRSHSNHSSHAVQDSDQYSNEREFLSVYAIGGFATYDRKKLDYLGGFNELLSPFHWEDIDLSYRGWKCGWKVLYEPGSRAFHRTSATINAHYEKKKVEEISFRNRLLFHWINLHSPGFIFRHLFTLSAMTLANALMINRSYFNSLFSALRVLRKVRLLRAREKERAVVSDKKLSQILNQFYKSGPIKVYYSLQEIKQEHPESL